MPRSNQERREEIEDRLLVRWAEAETAGDAFKADGVLTAAEAAARAVAQAGGDTMARDEVALIRRTARGSRERDALVKAHLEYGRARQAFLAERLSEASMAMSAASLAFASADSPYRFWAQVYRGISLWIRGSGEQAIRELASVPVERVPATYYNLRGRLAWTKAMALQIQAHHDLARPLLEHAHELYLRAGETEYQTVNASYLAEVDWLLGNKQDMWRREVDALAHVDGLPRSARRSQILESAAILALGEDLSEAALAFQQHLFHLLEADAEGSGRPVNPTAYLRRGQTFASLGETNAALDDFERAGRAATNLPDVRLRDWMIAEIQAARAALLSRKDPGAAISAAEAALTFYRTFGSVARTSESLIARARAYEARVDIAQATRDYDDAISALERDEDGVTAPQERKAAYNRQRVSIREAVRFTALVRHDLNAALWLAERGRARVLRQTFGGTTAKALNPVVGAKDLAADVAVLYYVTLSDRILCWVLSAEGTNHFAVTIDSSRLGHVLRRLYRKISNDGTIRELAPELEVLKPLIEPALAYIAPRATLVIVPDEHLATVPFAAVPDTRGAPLVTTHPVLYAPSFTTFMLASKRLTGFEPDAVLAIGDGHDPSATRLPLLKFADVEATAVSRLYPHGSVLIGAKATPSNFLNAWQPVIHFAGHTVANPEFPSLSRLLLAPDSGGGYGSGVLLASDIASHTFPNTRLVVLASCESAAGRYLEGEGFDSVARLFLDAGVPSVVASLWRLDDDAMPLLIQFHRELRTTRDAARALRAAQLTLLGDSADRQPLRRWAGFLVVGGANSLQFRGGAR